MYVGNRYTVSVSGSRWKPVHCSHCRAEWAYKVSRQATGEGRSPYFLDNDGAQQRARSSATQNLERLLASAADDIACPKCGNYQDDMVQRLRSKQHTGLMVLGFLSFIAAVGTILVGAASALVPTLVIAGLLIAGGVAALVYRGRLQAAYDPNADARSRARRDVSGEANLILREHYEEIITAAAAQGMEDQLQRIEWQGRARAAA
ncbi:MAG: hypothetical protein ACYC8T_28715 [Myxococcaceae bacterium]